MKRFMLVVFLLIFIGVAVNEGVYAMFLSTREKDKEMLNSISSKLIRFHVIANSDSEEDQNLKLKVKDEVLKYLAPELEKCTTIEESRQLLRDNDNKVKAIAEKVIRENGYSYEVKSELSKENFPVKTYGPITLPQGNYEAYRILIGNAGGQNWWCVMFPPLCFIDITKGEVAEEKTIEQMKEVLSEEELEYVENDSENIQFKFKIVEIYNKLKKRL
ncbi:MAG: stage II sporulation protein R [Clostridiales bacterium]|uniref:stage II sporulation protein R n=1 Tax=Clostridium sp. N3C TaxID=1776758 RepID=UPI00092DFA2D|nr:stage II sporulation protein R [Clostridium sp. N3C]NLZ47717.1 stage II sporulation protein R [Clostridiales bacterium]SCN23856.1 stage II sporulation protein R [Clostridium sp. N3C]